MERYVAALRELQVRKARTKAMAEKLTKLREHRVRGGHASRASCLSA